MLDHFHETFPDLMHSLPDLRFFEQHDPHDLTHKSQPYAYVADKWEEVKLGVDVDEVREQGVAPEQWSALLGLRDKLCEGQKVGWFVVVCGDEERLVEEPEVPQTPKMGPSSMHMSMGSVESRKFSIRPSTASAASTRATSSSQNAVYSDTGPTENDFAKRRVRQTAVHL